MAEYHLTPQARGDLIDIGAFTTERWGSAQRDANLASMRLAFESIARGTAAVRKSDGVKAGVWSCRVQSHLIFFRYDRDENVEVLRILHASQDHVRHL